MLPRLGQVRLLSCLLLLAVTCVGQTITLSAKSGPPTSRVSVSGSGFPANTAVDVYFDTTDIALTATDAGGSFPKLAIQIPRSALPGNHYVTSVARSNSAAAQTGFVVWTAWPQFGFNASDQRYNPYENVLNTSNVGSLDVAWTFTTGAAILSSPALAGGKIYVTSLDTYLYALNATTGKLLWKFTTGQLLDSSPAVAQGMVYFGSWDENFYALNANTGAVVWSYPVPGVVIRSQVTVANGMVYIPIYVQFGGELIALDGKTGALQWTYSIPGLGWNAIAVSGGAVYADGSDGIYAINASTGALIWQEPLYDMTGGPAVSQGIVFISGPGNITTSAVNAASGQSVWVGNYASSFYAVGGGFLYGVAGDHSSFGDSLFGGMQANSGLGGWVFPTGYVLSSPPAVANGVVYAAVASGMYALDATSGYVLWYYPTGNQVSSAPLVANGMVYLTSQDAKLYAFGLPSGFASHVSAPAVAALHPNYALKLQTAQ